MDAVAAILTPGHEVNSDMSTPPFFYIEQESPAVHQVVNMREILGIRGSVGLAMATVAFHDANPKLLGAFRAAVAEAMAVIAADKPRAIDAYVAATGNRSSSVPTPRNRGPWARRTRSSCSSCTSEGSRRW